MHHSLILTKWGWAQRILLYFMVADTRSLITVLQPPVLTTALGHDVMMPCHLKLSHDERMVTLPVLYWYLTQNNTDSHRLFPSEKYERRVELLDKSRTTSNKSIVLKNVQWADSGKYLCKLSITTQRGKSFRRKGSETALKVYDTMVFNLTAHNDSLLWCQVNMTPDPGFVLSISHNGRKLQPADSAPGDAGAALPYVTLSETIPLKSEGEYECQLHLNRDLITKNIFYHLREPGVEVFPEPWLLYMALLLVPVTILLSLVTALLVYRC
ncbi:uncharacterized protein LOC117728233 isoform X2 [Cyclopterus lumpus]|uniref:uncharacterized protein LOC117728233 isoform X2 n=1 Tax=Cyclopterus lumpus TaxID=8103 RepID=UPI001487170B|nr:uncharacterized protein LOC117728233 isoform X2 [Cyclopterus lumpus]